MNKNDNKNIIKEIVHMFNDKSIHTAYLKRTIKSYIKDGFDINTKYLKGNTLAHYAVKYNVTGIFSFLYNLGLNLNICNDNFDAPIHQAVKEDKYMMVKELVLAGADINQGSEFEETALHLAVSEGNLKIIELLLELGIDKSLVDERNLSALDYALDEKNDQVIQLLKK